MKAGEVMIDWQTIYFIALTVVFMPMVICLIAAKIIEWRKERIMNAKQSLRAANKQLQEYEQLFQEQARLLSMYKADVKNFYECIEGTVDGKSICDWCDQFNECQLQAKGGKGCKEWEHKIQQQEAQNEG